MRVNILTLAFVSGLLLSTAALADETATPAAPAATPATDAVAPAAPAAAPAAHTPDDDIYCRTGTGTGTYIATRVCHTQREWKQITEDSRNTLHKMQREITADGIPREH